jgi:hypothetical protein
MHTYPTYAAQPGDISYTLMLSLEEAARGKVESIRIPRVDICEACAGTGQSWREDDGTCAKCNNMGSFKYEKTLEVRIPAGVDAGSRLRLAGEGNLAVSQVARGDVNITISVRKHELFDRKGRDLYTFVKLTEEELTKGMEIVVPTLLDGQKLLRIPPATVSRAVFRLAGLGLRSIDSSERGDFFVRIGTQAKDSASYGTAGSLFGTPISSQRSTAGGLFLTHAKKVVFGAGLLLLVAFIYIIGQRSGSDPSTRSVNPNFYPSPGMSPAPSYSPAPTPTPYRPPFSLPNGANITPPQGPRGDNTMTIDNTGSGDIAVKIISSSSQKTRRFVYVQANSTAVVRGLARELCLLRWESGTDWDVKARRFLYYRALHQFDETFDLRKIRYTIHFEATPSGTLRETPINESDFEDK